VPRRLWRDINNVNKSILVYNNTSTNSQRLPIILAERDLIQFLIDTVKSFQIDLEPAAWSP